MQGIYMIINIINNKKYIGKSKNIKNRFKYHTYKLESNKHYNKHLQRAWNKYGKNNFEFKIIEEINNENELNEKEKYWIKYYNSIENGYNKTPGGDGGNVYKYKTVEQMNEIKKKISEANKGRIVSLETKLKISKANKNKKRSKEISNKLSILRTGKISAKKGKHYINQSECQKGEKAYWYGKHRNEETKQKISMYYKSGGPSKEARKKMSDANKNKIVSEKTKLKMSIAQKGHTVTEETKKKLSISNKKILSEQEIQLIIKLFNNGESINNIRKITKIGYCKIKEVQNKFSKLITEESKLLRKQNQKLNLKISMQYTAITKNEAKNNLMKKYIIENKTIDEIVKLFDNKYLKETIQKFFIELEGE